MEGVGLTPEDKNKPGMMKGMIAQGVGTFLLAWVIGITETTDSLATAILIALTIAVLIKAGGFFSGKRQICNHCGIRVYSCNGRCYDHCTSNLLILYSVDIKAKAVSSKDGLFAVSFDCPIPVHSAFPDTTGKSPWKKPGSALEIHAMY